MLRNYIVATLVGFIRLNLFVKIDLQQWLHPFEDLRSPPTPETKGFCFSIEKKEPYRGGNTIFSLRAKRLGHY